MSDREAITVPWRGKARKDVFGYADKLGVTVGDHVEVKVSCERPNFRADIVRLRHGIDDPAGPGVRETVHSSGANGEYKGRVQRIRAGSYMKLDDCEEFAELNALTCSAWIRPSPASQSDQGVICRWNEIVESGFALLVGANSDLECWIGDSGREPDRLRTGVPIPSDQWTFVAASVDFESRQATLVQRPNRRWPHADAWATVSAPLGCGGVGDTAGSLFVAAIGEEDIVYGHFDGKIESPAIWRRALTVTELESEAHVRASRHADADLIAAWDFSESISSRRVIDRSPTGLDALLVNMPARGVTGRRWTGEEHSWKQAPEHYAAIHFHSDDVEDVGWETDLRVVIDESYPSGLYAIRLIAGDSEDRVPFVVRPGPDADRTRVVVLLPTLTWQAYANANHFGGPSAKVEQAEDRWIADHGLRGLYDVHRDGSPVYYASRLQPSTMRPNYYAQNIGAPARMSADLFLIDWLLEQNIDHDVITDQDLHREGSELLSHYPVVITGSHPEYWTREMVDGLRGYLDTGGCLAYLGGELCYWVTTLDPQNDAVMEVRRDSGSRTWTALPGEHHHSATGERGGLWRYSGHTTQSIAGTGYTAWGSEQGSGYRRLPDSCNPRASFIFEGVGDDEVIGNFGLVLGGAAGYEMDRLDYGLGTPPHALLLASSVGSHSESFVPAIEDVMDASEVEALKPDHVRADMVFFETGTGGAVFSTGSIAWSGSLSHNNYDNNVARISRNVIQRFASGVPFDVCARSVERLDQYNR